MSESPFEIFNGLTALNLPFTVGWRFSTSESLTLVASGYDSVMQSQRNQLMHTYNGNPILNLSEHLKDTHIRDVQDGLSLKLYELISFTSHSQASTQTPSFTISLSLTIPSTQSTIVHSNPAFSHQEVLSPNILTLDSLIPQHNISHSDSDLFQRAYSRSLWLQFQHFKDDEV